MPTWVPLRHPLASLANIDDSNHGLRWQPRMPHATCGCAAAAAER